MRILILYPVNKNEIRNRKSALGSYILCLAGILSDAGWEVWINDEPLSAFLSSPYVESMMVHASGLRKRLGKMTPAWLKHRKRLHLAERKVKDCIDRLPETGFDHVLEYYTAGSVVGLAAKKKYNCRLTVVFDAPVLEEYKFFYGSSKYVENQWAPAQRETMMEANQVVVYSSAMRSWITGQTGERSDIFIHQNVDFTRFTFMEPRVPVGNEPVVIGFIGSFLKWHRVNMLVEVFEDMRSEGKNVELVLLGMGQEWQAVQYQVSASEFKNNIYLPGFADGDQLDAWKRKMHIGVMPGSNWYGAPNKIFEYGAAGVAVVGPDTPAILDIFSEEGTVCFFDWDNRDSLKKRLEMLVDNTETRQSYQHRLQQFIRGSYTHESTRNFYLNLLSNGK